MGTRSRRKQSPKSDRAPSASLKGEANGTMSGGVEMRRKSANPGADNVANNFMSRENFSLDEEPPKKDHGSNDDVGFFDLPVQDQRNFLLLVMLYFLQGIPMGLAMGSGVSPNLKLPFPGTTCDCTKVNAAMLGQIINTIREGIGHRIFRGSAYDHLHWN